MNYYIAIGTPGNHSGIECQIESELQIGDYVEMWHDQNKDEDDGEMVIVTHRFYCTMSNNFIFYAKKWTS